jgi:hypothetical protein
MGGYNYVIRLSQELWFAIMELWGGFTRSSAWESIVTVFQESVMFNRLESIKGVIDKRKVYFISTSASLKTTSGS